MQLHMDDFGPEILWQYQKMCTIIRIYLHIYIYIVNTYLVCLIQNCRFLTFLDYDLVIKMYLDVLHFRMEKGDSHPAKIGE